MFLVSFRTLAISAVCIGVVAIFPSNAGAQRFDKGTTITINEPFEVPGTTLPPGEYVIRLMEVAGNRNVVQILSSDEKKTFAIVLAIPDYRLKAPEKTAITFYEVDRGAPLPLHAWFYPGSNFGVEFVYPKRKAIDIARISGEHVIAATAPALFPEATPSELKSAPIIAIEPGGEEVEVVTVHAAPPEPVLSAAVEEPPSLPTTATPLPFVGLIGLLAAGAAAALRHVRRI